MHGQIFEIQKLTVGNHQDNIITNSIWNKIRLFVEAKSGQFTKHKLLSLQWRPMAMLLHTDQGILYTMQCFYFVWFCLMLINEWWFFREGLSTRPAASSDEIQLRIDPMHADLDDEITGLRSQVRRLRNVCTPFIFYLLFYFFFVCMYIGPIIVIYWQFCYIVLSACVLLDGLETGQN